MAASVDAASLPVTSQPSDPLATAVAPDDALTQANQALALYQMGEVDHSLQALKQIARHYPRFPDVRAALAAALWAQGKQGEAESHWVAAVGMDQRYQDVTWVSQQRRWPPAMVTALAQFLQSQ
jgi:predicted Zn-dependent protease